MIHILIIAVAGLGCVTHCVHSTLSQALSIHLTPHCTGAEPVRPKAYNLQTVYLNICSPTINDSEVVGGRLVCVP